MLLIADDFTGACDTAVQFARPGRPCRVVLYGREEARQDSDLPGSPPPAPIETRTPVMIDTESRHLPEAEAAALVQSVARAWADLRSAASSPARHALYKKIDSTLRGNVRAEVAALQELFPERVVLACPAFPKAGRTTTDGRCLVGGVPVEETEFADDPHSPVTSSRIADYVAKRGKVREVEAAAVGPALSEAKPGQTLIVDANSNAELARIAEAVAPALDRLILVGSAGLANALSSVLAGREEHTPVEPDEQPESNPEGPRAPVLGFVGSLHPASREQVRLAQEELELDTHELSRQPEEKRAMQIVEGLRTGRAAIVQTPPAATPAAGAGAADYASEFGTIALHVCRNIEELRVFATGGETALAVIRALVPAGIFVVREIEPGIPLLDVASQALGRTIGMVTKAGGFGTSESILRSLRALSLAPRHARNP